MTDGTTHDDAGALWAVSLGVADLFGLILDLRAGEAAPDVARAQLAEGLAASVADLTASIRGASAHLDSHVKWQSEWTTITDLVVVAQHRSRETLSVLRGCLEELDRSLVCTKRAIDLDRPLGQLLELLESADRLGVRVSRDELMHARAGMYAAATALGASVRRLDRSRDEVASIVRAADAGAYDPDAPSASIWHVGTVSRAMADLRARALATGQPAFLGDAPILDD